MDCGRIIYICYNGIDEPLVASQVLAYLSALAGEGYRFTLITFERKPVASAADRGRELAGRGIDWVPVTTRLRQRALRDGVLLAQCLLAANRQAGGGASVIHARSFVPALVARLLKLVRPVCLVNDIRGFWIEEKVYRGALHAGGWLHRSARRLEAWVYRGSDHIVSLTDAAQREIAGFPCFRRGGPPPITTIPTCVDLARFAAPAAAQREDTLTVGYLGSLSDVYLPEEILRFFSRLHAVHPEARLHLVSNSDPAPLHRAAAQAGLGRELYRLESARFEEVPAHVARFDLALSFIKPGYAKIASCPTKVGEYLAAGVPVVANAGIGDMDQLLGAGSGYLLPDFSAAAFDGFLLALPALLGDPAVADNCRRLAASHFDLQRGVQLYRQVYADTAGGSRAPVRG